MSKFSLLAFAFVVFLLSTHVSAQVIIKEKVEINPQEPLRGENPIFSFPDSVYNRGGNQSINKNPVYQLDNLQSTFPLIEGGRVTVEILYSEAAENSQINLLLRQPDQQTLIEYANHNEGFTWVSPDYFGNTNFEIGIYWYWENEGTLYEGSESGAEVLSLGSDEYYIGFEAAGDDWDYNELVVRVKIETYLPLVLIDPPNISTGETAVVTVKKQFYDGRIEDFPEGQLFEFGMMEGCAAGVLVSDTDTSNYFNGVTQPVIFVAADSLESDEETVKIGVGVVEQNPLAKMQTKTNVLTQPKNRFRDENNTDAKDDEISIDAIIIGSCFGGDFESDKRGDENLLVVVNECDEEIVVCNNYQPPKFEDVSTITELGENDPWHWIDDQGTPQTTNTGTACDYDINANEYGKTYIMPSIGDYASAPIYNRLDDMQVTVCLDKSDNQHHYWKFSVLNIRVPIFTAHCPTRPKTNGYVDLIAGANTDTLAKYIKNCNDYSNVMETLNWWRKGPYRQCGQSPPHKFYFSAGTIAHEKVHVKQLRDGSTTAFPVASISKVMNGPLALKSLETFKLEKTIQGAYKCPEDALAQQKDRVRELLNTALYSANNLKRQGGYAVKFGCQDANSEFEADELARPKYDEIKKSIENWAKQQSWWCIPWPIVGDDYYRGCDQSKCTP